MIVRGIVLSSVLVLPAVFMPTHAVEGDAPSRFRVVSAEDGQQLERRLRSAAEEGFRLFEAAQGVSVDGRPRIAVLMEHAEGGVTSEYRALTCSGIFRDDGTRQALDDLGAQGFRLLRRGIVAHKLKDFWLPDSAYEEQMVLILEHDPAGRSWVQDALTFGQFESFYRDLADRRRRGFEVVGMWNSHRTLQVIVQKPKDAPQVDHVPEHRLLIMATRTVLRLKLEQAANEGFRIMAAEDPSVTGPPILLMERVAGRGNSIDYKLVDDLPQRARKDSLEKKLNKRATNGYRVARDGITREAIAVERPAKKKDRKDRGAAHYRMLSSRRAPGLPRALEDAMSRGYTFVRMFVEPDATTVLVEKIQPSAVP